MTKLQERVLKEYTTEYMWAKYYHTILDLDSFNMEEEEKRENLEKYAKHSYAMNVAARCFSIRESRKYFPDARAKAVEMANDMYVNWLNRFYKDCKSSSAA